MSAAQKEGDILFSSLLLQWARGSLHAQSLDSVSASLIRALCSRAGRRKRKQSRLSAQNGFFFECGWNVARSNLPASDRTAGGLGPRKRAFSLPRLPER